MCYLVCPKKVSEKVQCQDRAEKGVLRLDLMCLHFVHSPGLAKGIGMNVRDPEDESVTCSELCLPKANLLLERYDKRGRNFWASDDTRFVA